jgi:hypothetical protein
MGDTGRGAIAEPGTEAGLLRSATPKVYVPLRFRVGGIDGVPTGAAIVGTPQGDGMVAIDIEIPPYVEPNPEAWSDWIAAAARRHLDEREDPGGGSQPTRLVSEAALVEIGTCVRDRVRIDDAARGAQLSRWIQAGRADYVVDQPFPHEP